MPAELFCEAFGEYVPRLCVDTAVIGPGDSLHFERMTVGLIPHFHLIGPHGIALKERNEEPRKGQWGLPGGSVFKGETLADASKRIILKELGLEIEVLGEIGSMEFPNEVRTMEMADGTQKQVTIDSKSVVLLARAKFELLISKRARWFKKKPLVEHEYHTPFLQARGFLPE